MTQVLKFLCVLRTGNEEDTSISIMLVALSAYLLVAIAACMTVRYTYMFFAALFEWIAQNHLFRLLGNAEQSFTSLSSTTFPL